MLELTLDNFFTLLAFLILIPIVMASGLDFWRSVTRYWEPSEEKIIDCPNCHYSFLVRPRRKWTSCPACKEQVKVRLKRVKHLKY